MQDLKKVLAVCDNCGRRSWLYDTCLELPHYCYNCDCFEYFTVIDKEEQKMEKSNITIERKVDAIKSKIATLSSSGSFNEVLFYDEMFTTEELNEIYCWVDDALYIYGTGKKWRLLDSNEFKHLIESLCIYIEDITLSLNSKARIGLATAVKESAHTITTPAPIESRTQAVAAASNGKLTLTEEIDHPKRYCKGGVECIDAIAAATSNLVGVQAVDTGAVIRYMWRWADKGGIQDLEKAKNYIDYLIKDIQENGIRKQ